jgi:uncharacterized protein YneR
MFIKSKKNLIKNRIFLSFFNINDKVLNFVGKEFFNSFLRVIELNSRKKLKWMEFAESIPDNYLCLQNNKFKIDSLKYKNTYPYRKIKNISKTEADILILNGFGPKASMWFFQNYCQFEYIVIDLSFFDVISLVGILKNIFLKKIKLYGLISLERGRELFVFKNVKRVCSKNRRYISPILGVEGFFKELNQSKIKYSVLRWFDDLPNLPEGEDIDMLVDDPEIFEIDKIFKRFPGIIPCDVYSVSAVNGTGYNKMAYYPPKLAREILTNSYLFKNIIVPNSKYHFLSLAYHVVFHKGIKSGLPCKQKIFSSWVDHDYASVLRDLANKNNFDVEITLEGLHEFLKKNDWVPPLDTIRRLSALNEWIKINYSFLYKNINKTNENGLVVFVIREAAVSFGFYGRIMEMIKDEGFSIILSEDIPKNKVDDIKFKIRGGNWDRGPWPHEGGLPSKVVVAYDLLPRIPSEEELKKYPDLGNKRILVKNKIRNEINRLLPKDKHCNILHSSDNEVEAYEYIDSMIPDKKEFINNKIENFRLDFKTDGLILKDLTHHGRRAKVELIKYGGDFVVKKTFKPGFEDFMKNEICARREFEDCTEVPRIIKKSKNFFMMPYYKNDLKLRYGKLMPISVAKKSINFLKTVHDKGYCLIDSHPTNVIYNKKDGLKFIDFEFLYKYKKPSASFFESYDITGVPDDFEAIFPANTSFKGRNYKICWEPYCGLSLKSLLDDSFWLQVLKRFKYKIELMLDKLKRRSKVMFSIFLNYGVEFLKRTDRYFWKLFN